MLVTFIIESSTDNPEKYYIEVVMQDKLALNIEYIKKASFIKDIKLIFRTLWKIVV